MKVNTIEGVSSHFDYQSASIINVTTVNATTLNNPTITDLSNRVTDIETGVYSHYHYVSANSMVPRTSGNPSWDQTLPGYRFRSGFDETVYMSISVPNGVRIEANINTLVQWTKTTSQAGLVNWVMKYQWIPRETVPEAAVDITGVLLEPDGDIADKHLTTFMTQIPSKPALNVLLITLTRVGTDGVADTYPADARLLGVNFQFTCDYLPLYS